VDRWMMWRTNDFLHIGLEGGLDGDDVRGGIEDIPALKGLIPVICVCGKVDTGVR